MRTKNLLNLLTLMKYLNEKQIFKKTNI